MIKKEAKTKIEQDLMEKYFELNDLKLQEK